LVVVVGLVVVGLVVVDDLLVVVQLVVVGLVVVVDLVVLVDLVVEVVLDVVVQLVVVGLVVVVDLVVLVDLDVVEVVLLVVFDVVVGLPEGPPGGGPKQSLSPERTQQLFPEKMEGFRSRSSAMVRPFLEQISWHPSFFWTTYSLSQLLPPPPLGGDAQTCVTARAARVSDFSNMAAEG